MINNSWILAIRTDNLTTLFKFMPFFASDYFYITIIAVGYWLNPARRLFKYLGFLVSFSTLFNCLLKNAFHIPRPDPSLYLISISDQSFGFPSGDVQVATVFWTMILLNLKNNFLRSLCIIPIITIGLSRIYLGVHSIYDVTGGLIFGLTIVYIWQKHGEEYLLTPTHARSQRRFWKVFFFTVLAYVVFSQGITWAHVVPVSIGSFIGFGLSLKWMNEQSDLARYKMTIWQAALSMILLIVLVKVIPVIQTNMAILFLCLMLKYVIIVFGIFSFVPQIVHIIVNHALRYRK
jgi:hypothetical protein